MTVSSWIRWSALALMALSLGNITGAKGDDASTLSPAFKSVQGVWRTDEGDILDSKWTFKGEELKASVNGTDYAAKVKIDDKAKPHPTMDLELTDGPGDAKGKTAKAIYKVEGEKLIVAVSVPGGDRPTDYEPSGDEIHLFEMKKQKAD